MVCCFDRRSGLHVLILHLTIIVHHRQDGVQHLTAPLLKMILIHDIFLDDMFYNNANYDFMIFFDIFLDLFKSSSCSRLAQPLSC